MQQGKKPTISTIPPQPVAVKITVYKQNVHTAGGGEKLLIQVQHTPSEGCWCCRCSRTTPLRRPPAHPRPSPGGPGGSRAQVALGTPTRFSGGGAPASFQAFATLGSSKWKCLLFPLLFCLDLQTPPARWVAVTAEWRISGSTF